jgi:hypothetical protein
VTIEGRRFDYGRTRILSVKSWVGGEIARVSEKQAEGCHMPEISAELSAEDIAALTTLAAKRGVSANTVLQQAIATEKLLDQNVSPNDKVIIKKSDNAGIELVFKEASTSSNS